MGWLSKIFKGSSHKISEGHYPGNYGEDPNTNHDAPSSSGVISHYSISLPFYFSLWSKTVFPQVKFFL